MSKGAGLMIGLVAVVVAAGGGYWLGNVLVAILSILHRHWLAEVGNVQRKRIASGYLRILRQRGLFFECMYRLHSWSFWQ